MKFRRHTSHGFDWTAVWRTVATPFTRLSQVAARRRALVWVVATAGAFGIGYLVAAVFFFPAPIFAETIQTPRLIGMPRADAERVLRNGGLEPGDVESEMHPTAARGDVVWQDPAPGVAVQQGQTVQLWVSSGPQRIPVVDLAGYDAGVARQLLQASGLAIGRVDSTQAPLPRGVVVNTRPPAGTPLSPGAEVTVVVSVGAPTIPVPNLVGHTREEAVTVLEEDGLVLGLVKQHTTQAAPAGQIIEQQPAPGTLAAPGTAVTVTVARGSS